MAIGERIRFFRNMKGITQKYLGMVVGFPERSADVRMAQYETGSRTPRAALLKKMADILQVDVKCIAVPTGFNKMDIIYRLFLLEDHFPEMGLERNSQTGEIVINLHNKELNGFLPAWDAMRKKREQGLITEEEYLNWKYGVPME